MSYKLLTYFQSKINLFFFGFFLVVGLFVSKDYGIGWDDECSRVYTGYVNYDYILNQHSSTILESSEKYHGPFVEVVLVIIEKTLGLTDTHSIYLMRHVFLFLIFYLAVWVFYFLAKKLVGNIYALIACLMLVLSPRIFAESFYNSKDIVFLSFFIFSLYSHFLFLENKNTKWAILHGLFTGFLIDIRILGILMPILSILYFVLLMISTKSNKQYWKSLPIYIIATICCIILCWPVLWEGPIFHFSNAFIEMRKFHWESFVLYQGNGIMSTQLPWHYLLVWIGISTPVLYLLLFVIGLLIFLFRFVSKPIHYTIEHYKMNSILFFIVAPLFSIIVMKSVVYDGWRHVYFIYPCIILFSIYGFQSLMNWVKSSTWMVTSLYAIILINAILVVGWMVRNHPHENVYFNAISRKCIPDIGNKFELDYWGLSYHQAYEFLHKKYPTTQPIKVSAENTPGKDNLLYLPLEQRNHFKYYERNDSSYQFYITNYRDDEAPKNMKPEYIIKVDGISILGIYRRY